MTQSVADVTAVSPRAGHITRLSTSCRLYNTYIHMNVQTTNVSENDIIILKLENLNRLFIRKIIRPLFNLPQYM